MDGRGRGGESFVAVRRMSNGLGRGTAYHSTPPEVVTGSAAWLGRGLSCVCVQISDSDARPSFDLTTMQEECLDRLQSRLDVPYDSSIPEHQEPSFGIVACFISRKGTTRFNFRSVEGNGLARKRSNDRFFGIVGGGFISLENLLYFARNFPKSFQDLLRKKEGNRADWEYPFDVAGVNITFMLIQMLDLEAFKPRTLVGAAFLKFHAENESAFDLLYCITFKLMDRQWLAKRASYMDFNVSVY
ncbi:hypothetical protein SASPL_106128 [Salvia splendens]|uniref:ELMO domain-containing protein n=1 Tax=Salvia splendens TaxID=180675 RepID=A0A8X8YQS4_SALSN|nr:hypothetical protein SASPL_106128 [Salvia splendens]